MAKLKFYVAGFDAYDNPRAWGAADVLSAAVDEAAKQASAYIEEKRKLGETVALRLFIVYGDGSKFDLLTTIRHETQS